jgi:hypothetical protein
MDWYIIRNDNINNRDLIIVTNGIKKYPLFFENSADKDITLTINNNLVIINIGDIKHPLYVG